MQVQIFVLACAKVKAMNQQCFYLCLKQFSKRFKSACLVVSAGSLQDCFDEIPKHTFKLYGLLCVFEYSVEFLQEKIEVLIHFVDTNCANVRHIVPCVALFQGVLIDPFPNFFQIVNACISIFVTILLCLGLFLEECQCQPV